MRKEAFVTGGAGFIGSRLSEKLIHEGYKVRCFDNLDPLTINPQTVNELILSPHFELIEGDILDLTKLKRELGNPDVIIHCAAIAAVDRSIRNPQEAVEINTTGTMNVIEAAREKGAKRVHYVSTDEVFGHSKDAAFNENSPSKPRNAYAAGKLGGEGIVTAWGATYGMEVTITNSVNNYGLRQSPDKLIPRLTVRGLLGKSLPVYGDGQQIREWLFVDDHVDAILHVLDHGTFNQRYLVGSGERKANIDVVNKILQFLNLPNAAIEYIEDRKGHDMRYAVDSSKIRALGWSPKWTFEEGIEQTIEWYKNNKHWWEYYMFVYPDLEPELVKEF